MKEMSKTIGTMEFDGLITGLTPAVQVGSGVIAKGAAATTYKRGTVFAKSAQDGKLRVLGTEPPTPESGKTADTYTANCILCEAIEVGTQDDETVCVYTAGSFDPDKLTLASGYTMTEADIDQLRAYDIVLRAAQ